MMREIGKSQLHTLYYIYNTDLRGGGVPKRSWRDDRPTTNLKIQHCQPWMDFKSAYDLHKTPPIHTHHAGSHLYT